MHEAPLQVQHVFFGHYSVPARKHPFKGKTTLQEQAPFLGPSAPSRGPGTRFRTTSTSASREKSWDRHTKVQKKVVEHFQPSNNHSFKVKHPICDMHTSKDKHLLEKKHPFVSKRSFKSKHSLNGKHLFNGNHTSHIRTHTHTRTQFQHTNRQTHTHLSSNISSACAMAMASSCSLLGPCNTSFQMAEEVKTLLAMNCANWVETSFCRVKNKPCKVDKGWLVNRFVN